MYCTVWCTGEVYCILQQGVRKAGPNLWKPVPGTVLLHTQAQLRVRGRNRVRGKVWGRVGARTRSGNISGSGSGSMLW